MLNVVIGARRRALAAALFVVVLAVGMFVPTTPAVAADPIDATLSVDRDAFTATPFTRGPFVYLTTPGSGASVNPQIWDGTKWVFVNSKEYLGEPAGTGESDKYLVSTGAVDLLRIVELHQGRKQALPGNYSIRFVLPPRSGWLGMGVQDEYGQWTYPRASFSGVTSDAVSLTVSRAPAPLTGWPGGETTWVQQGSTADGRTVEIDVHSEAVVDVDLQRSVDGRTWESVRTYSNGTFSWTNDVTFSTQQEDTQWRLYWRGSELVESFVSDVYTVRTYPAIKVTASMNPAVVIKEAAHPAKMRVRISPALSGVATATSWVAFGNGYMGSSVGGAALKAGAGYVDLELEDSWMDVGTHRVRVDVTLDDYPLGVESNDVTVTVFRRATAAIEGTPRVGAVLTARPGKWPAGTQLSYQWYAGFDKVPGATQPTFTPRGSDFGKVVHVVVTGFSNGRVLDEVRSEATRNLDIGRLATATPTIAGTAKVGVTLTAKPGAWTAGTAFSYQWSVAGKAVSGATKPTCVPRAADTGKTVTVKVTGKKAGFTTTTATSKATAKVAAASKLKTAVPTIAGRAKVGVTLSAKPGVWTAGTSFAYRWSVAGKAVSGATKSTFVPRASDAGKTVTVRVTGKKAGYVTAAVTSKSTAKVAAASKLKTAVPTIAGTAKVGVTLTAKAGAWTAGTSFSYRWSVAGKAVPRATKSTFVPPAADAGKTVTVKVTGKKAGYTSASVTSKASGTVAAAR